LTVREKIIGVLDVQSEKPGAFTEEDINILSILADQVAIAIENSKLFQQTQTALEEARTAYQQNIREGWQNFSQDEGIIGYQQSLSSSKKLIEPFSSDEINQSMNKGQTLIFHADGKTNEPTLVIPIKLREQIIGVIHVKAPRNDRQWTSSEVNLTEAVSERLSLALENARLIQESQRQVIKEQTIGEITTRISSSTNLENVLLTAVEELGRTIPGSEVTIKLKKDESGQKVGEEKV
jgi:GAF domain-containing protein